MADLLPQTNTGTRRLDRGKRVGTCLAAAALVLGLGIAAQAAGQSWRSTKNTADDRIYRGRTTTFYCGCSYRSDGDSDGSGKITDYAKCGYASPTKHRRRATRVEWEHVVPASLTPARNLPCWSGKGGRAKCEKNSPEAQAIIFDLHNLVPSIGQVNALRSNDRFADLSKARSTRFGKCGALDTRGKFEPPDCKKGDTARIWLYMRDRHGVYTTPDEEEMFARWSAADPVSPWESEREKRISSLTGVSNLYVKGQPVDRAGECQC